MKKWRHLGVVVLALVTSVTAVSAAGADTVGPITFEPPTYVVGDIHGQDGWMSAGPYDHMVAPQSLYSIFGTQSLRISNAIASGSFGDQTFSKQLVNEAGEASAQGDGVSGPRQRFFAAGWLFASAVPTAEQPGLSVVASPDRGDGARMSWVQMTDTPTGLAVNFNEYRDRKPYGKFLHDPNGCDPEDDGFVESNVAKNLKRNVPHLVVVTMQFKDGPRNDLVQVYVDGKQRETGTSWEDYFRYCEGNPTRTVDSILFRTSVPALLTLGNGFLIDGFTLYSGKNPGGGHDHDDRH